MHIEAAARQLETLAKLEQRQAASPFRLDDGHIRRDSPESELAISSKLTGPSTTSTTLHEPFENEVLPFVASHSILPRSSLASHPGIRDSGSRLTAATGLSLGLSSELRRILNMSTLDPEVSLLVGNSAADDYETATERQYLWLERYHQHVAAQQREQPNIPADAVNEDKHHEFGSSVV